MAESTDCPSNMSDEDPTKQCNPCKFRGIHRQAGTHCQECSEYLCDTCEEIHLSFKATRGHELQPFGEQKRTSMRQRSLISATMTCGDHRSEVLSLLCLDHNEPACQQCKLTKHRRCPTRTLKKVADKAKSQRDVVQFVENVKSLTVKLQDIRESREKDKKTLQSCSEKLIIEIQQLKQDIIAWASKFEKDMLDEVESTTGKLLADVDEDARTAGAMVNQLEDVTNSLDILGLDVPATSLVIALTEQRKLDEGERIMNDILKGVKPVKMSFDSSKKLVTALSKITSMGTLNTDIKDERNICFQEISSLSKKRDESDICFQEITSLSKKETINTSGVTGCVFMPDGELVVCEGRRTVKVLTRDLNLRHEIQLHSLVWDVAVVSKDEVIVTLPESNLLQLLIVSGEINKGKSFSVDRSCFGVDCKNDMIYVCCLSYGGNVGEIKVLTMTGVTLNTFKINQGSPEYLAVNSPGDRIVISTNMSTVLCTDMTGKVLYTYTESELNHSRGVMFDKEDNVIVCGCYSHNIHVVNRDGTKQRVIMTSDDGVNLPHCLAYRASDRTLVVGTLAERYSLLTFTVNK